MGDTGPEETSGSGTKTESQLTVALTSDGIASAMQKLLKIAENPETFQEKLMAAFEEKGQSPPPALQVTVKGPKRVQLVLRRKSSEWSHCKFEQSVGGVCKGNQTRNVSCVRASNTSDVVNESLCLGLQIMDKIRECEDRSCGAPEVESAESAGGSSSKLPIPSEGAIVGAALLMFSAFGIGIYCRWKRLRQRRKFLKLKQGMDGTL